MAVWAVMSKSFCNVYFLFLFLLYIRTNWRAFIVAAWSSCSFQFLNEKCLFLLEERGQTFYLSRSLVLNFKLVT